MRLLKHTRAACLWEEGKESACAMRGAGHSSSSRSTAGTSQGRGPVHDRTTERHEQETREADLAPWTSARALRQSEKGRVAGEGGEGGKGTSWG